jgi:hypothetical protein
MKSRSTVYISSFLLLCTTPILAQAPPATLFVRIAELSSAKYTCTVLTQDGRLRREVTTLFRGQADRPDVFEGVASDEDMKRLKTLVAQNEFAAATRNHQPGMTMVSPTGRILTVEANFDGTLKTVSFADNTGRTPIPPYLVELSLFADDVKTRNLPKLKGKIQSICRPLSHHVQTR